MPVETWKVRYFEVRPHAEFLRDGGAPAVYVDTFGVQADGSDAAKQAASKWLQEHGKKLRSLAIEAAPARQLVAYIESQPKPKVTT